MHKKILLFSVLTLMTLAAANAQEEQKPSEKKGSWTTSSAPSLKISEFMYENWSSSGNSQIDVTGMFFGNYKFTHPNYVWDNIVDLAYGYAWQDLDNSSADTAGGLFETRRKSNDKIDINSAIFWNAYKNWGVSLTANLKSQFGPGYEYSGIGENQKQKQVSGFFAPAYLTTALSFERKKENWSVSLSFLTGKTTFVCNDSLIANGYTYGVIQEDTASFTHAYFALGSYVKAMYLKKDILPKLDFYARAELFYDYKKPKDMSWNDLEHTRYVLARGDDGSPYDDLASFNWMERRLFETDIDFELKLDYRFASFLSANLALNLKWDTDYSGLGRWGHLQLYQMAGVRILFQWKTPNASK